VTPFIDENRGRFGVEPICRTLDVSVSVSVSAYYQRRSGQRSARRIEDERLTGVIRRLHRENYRHGGSPATALARSDRPPETRTVS
jgi:putative transposase